MSTLADAYIRVRPDATGFETDLAAKMRAAGLRGGEAAGSAAGEAINARLRALNLPEINLRASPTEALIEIDRVKAKLEEIARSSPTASLRVDAREGIAQMELFKEKLKLEAGIAGEEAGHEAGDRFGSGFRQSSIFSTVAGVLASKFALIGGAAAAAAPAVVNLGASLAPLIGSAVALPSLLTGGAAALGVFKLATSGVGSAIHDFLSGNMKAFATDMAALPPSAQNAVGALLSFQGAFKGLREAVAGNFWGPVIAQFDGLAHNIFPVLNNQLPQIAHAMGGFAAEILHAASSASFVRGLNDTLHATAQAIGVLTPAAGAVTDAFGRLLHAGAPALVTLAGYINEMAQAFDRFIQKAEATGKLQEWLQKAINTGLVLWQIIKNLAIIIGEFFHASSADGTNLLSTIEQLTQKFRVFLQSPQGQKDLENLFHFLNETGKSIVDALIPTLQRLKDSIAILGPQVLTLLPTFAEFLDALSPILAIFTGMAATILTAVNPALEAVAGWLKTNKPVTEALTIAVAGLWTAWKLGSVISTVTTFLSGAITGLKGVTVATDADTVAKKSNSAALGLNAAATKAWAAATAVGRGIQAAWTAITNGSALAQARLTLQLVLQKVAMIASAVAMAVVRAAVLAWTAAQWALNAAMDANPIGIIILAIVALIGIVISAIKYHRDLAQWARDAWHGIQDAAGAVANFFVGVIWPAIRGAITAVGAVFQWLYVNVVLPVWQGIQSVINAVVGWIISTFNGALHATIAALGAVWQWLWVNIVNPVWQGIQNIISAVVGFLVGLFDAVLGGAIRLLGSVWQWLYFNIVNPVWQAIQSIINSVGHFLMDLWNGMEDAIRVLGSVFQWLYSNVVVPVWNAIKDAINTVWQWVNTNVFGPLYHTVHDVIPEAFNAAVEAIRIAWDKIKEFCRAPVAFVVNTVYMQGIRPAWNFIASKVNLPPLPEMHFASGGFVSGPGGPTSDSIPARLSNGEFVINAAATKKYLSVLEAINTGNIEHGNTGIPYEHQGFCAGGLCEDPGSALKKKNKWDAQMYALGGLVQSFADGGLVLSIQQWLYQQKDKPYVMGAAGPGAYDCSGLVGAVWKMAHGLSPYGRVFDTSNEGAFFQPGWGGENDLNVGWQGGSGADGHTAGAIGGLYFEATPPHVLIGNVNMSPGKFTNHGHIPVGGGGAFQDQGGGGFCFPNPARVAFDALWDHTIGGPVKGWLNNELKGDTGFKPEARGVTNTLIDKIKSFIDSKLPDICIAGGAAGNDGNLADKQVEKIAYQTALAMGADARVMLALFEAGFVESGFRNLQTATDHDSLGFLQQRPSAGWPSPLNVATATHSFVSRAMAAEHSVGGSAGALAQAVQVSAFPARYDQEQAVALAALAQLGQTAAFANGGLVNANLYDSGGLLPPGLTMALNKTGRHETVTTADTMDDVIEVLKDILDKLGEVGHDTARAMGGGITTASRKRR
jgi:phage-related protein